MALLDFFINSLNIPIRHSKSHHQYHLLFLVNKDIDILVEAI